MLTLHVQLLEPVYEAGRQVAEWPPHPARAFSALVSVAEPGTADDDALRWLERQDPPVVDAPRSATSGGLEAWVPTNALVRKTGSTIYPGRTNGSRQWYRTHLAGPRLRFVWKVADADPGITATLDQLARRVPYLGRASGAAILSFGHEPPAEDWSTRFAPAAGGRTLVRVPYPGLLDDLRSAFDAGQRAHEIRVVRPYDEPVAATYDDAPAPNPYADLLMAGFRPGRSVPGRAALAVAGACKAAVLARLGDGREPGDPWPVFPPERLAAVHGHDKGDRRQMAFLALPFVGGEHASGELLGVGVAVPGDLDADLGAALVRLVTGGGLERRRLRTIRPRGRAVELVDPGARWALDSRRWTRPSTVWDSVLPIVLDRHPRRDYTEVDAVVDSCELAGLPRPVEVRVGRTSPVPGAPHLHTEDVRRRPGASQPPHLHARITFATRVAGPVILGQLRHLGLGLCAPGDVKEVER